MRRELHPRCGPPHPVMIKGHPSHDVDIQYRQTVLYSAVQCSAAQYSTVQYSTV